MITKSSFLCDSPRGRRNKSLLLSASNRRGNQRVIFFRKRNALVNKLSLVWNMAAVKSQENASNIYIFPMATVHLNAFTLVYLLT